MSDPLRPRIRSLEELEQSLIPSVAPTLLQLFLSGPNIQQDVFQRLAGCQTLSRLRLLKLSGMEAVDDGLALLTRSPLLLQDLCLVIERAGLSSAGLEALAQAPHRLGLRVLALYNRDPAGEGRPNRVDDAGLCALARSPMLADLQELDVSYNPVGDRGVEALVCSPWLAKLHTVTAWRTDLTNEGAKAAQQHAFSRWKEKTALEGYAVHCTVHTDFDQRTIQY